MPEIRSNNRRGSGSNQNNNRYFNATTRIATPRNRSPNQNRNATRNNTNTVPTLKERIHHFSQHPVIRTGGKVAYGGVKYYVDHSWRAGRGAYLGAGAALRVARHVVGRNPDKVRQASRNVIRHGADAFTWGTASDVLKYFQKHNGQLPNGALKTTTHVVDRLNSATMPARKKYFSWRK